MPIHAILLIILGAGTVSAAPIHHFQLATLAANAPGTERIAPNEETSDEQNYGRKQSHLSGKHGKPEGQSQTLTGMVEWEYKPLAWDCDVPNCDHFALYDDATHANYELDDARAALPFEGMRAKVTGIVDSKDSIIHVLSIERVK